MPSVGTRQRHASTTHTVFSTGCNAYFDWQALGLAHSHRYSGQPGALTRLLSECGDAVSRGRSVLQLPFMRTHEHPDYGDPATNGVGDRYPQYNKAGGLVHWLGNAEGANGSVAPPEASSYLRPVIGWGSSPR